MPGSAVGGSPPAATATAERTLLFLGHDWGELSDFLSTVNRGMATNMATFKGVNVYSTVLRDFDELPGDAHKDAVKCQVKLITPSGPCNKDARKRLQDFNADPISLFPNLPKILPTITHIVAHSPLTGLAGAELKLNHYPDSKLILFYHVLPPDVDWINDDVMPYAPPTDDRLVRLAEVADVVYSVTEKLHWYMTAKFRNRASVDIDHRLYIPQVGQQPFYLERKPPKQDEAPRILALGLGAEGAGWDGVDISACAINKVALAAHSRSSTRPLPVLVIGSRFSTEIDVLKARLLPYLTCPNLQVEFHVYKSAMNFMYDLSTCTMCIMPFRAEVNGCLSLLAVSAGIPTFVAEDSNMASLVSRLTSDPGYFLIPVTKTSTAVRQDASVWRDRIVSVLQDVNEAYDRAKQLQTALRQDELTKETHDDVTTFCLGGIRLKHEVTGVEFHCGRDSDKEVPMQRAVTSFISDTLRQCWRLKHNSLTKKSDLADLLPGSDDVNVDRLIKRVTNKIEEYDRRITGFDRQSGSFIVYCPAPDALSDLWAMCDVINSHLRKTMLTDNNNAILDNYQLKNIDLRTIISGPEFLKYKNELKGGERPKTAAF